MNEAADRARSIEERRRRVGARMARIKHKFVVLSGKGGVGKSTVAAYVASALAARGSRVGLLDTDIHGPSIPKMLGVEGKRITVVDDAIVPVSAGPNLKVMSVAFLLRSKSDAVIWRGPLKMTMIEEFLGNVDWGELDYLIIDSPPGTGDEPLSVCQFIPELDGAIVVATPQQIALDDVEKSITFCRQVKIPVAGVIENMSGYVCPHCNEQVDIFKTGGARKLAEEMGVPFLGKLPLVPEVVTACDEGRCFYADAGAAGLKENLDEITSNIVAIASAAGREGRGASAGASSSAAGREGRGASAGASSSAGGQEGTGAHAGASAGTAAGAGSGGGAAEACEGCGSAGAACGSRKIALPLDGETVSTHFGHSPEFAVFDITGGAIARSGRITPPPHSPGALPAWLKKTGVDVVIAGGIGQRAKDLLESSGIEVVTGAGPGRPEDLVMAYLAGTLNTGENVCDH